MGTEQFWQSVIEGAPSLGVGIIFVYFYMQERKYNRERDVTGTELHARSIEAQVKFTSALDNNTDAIKAMTSKVEKCGARDQKGG